MMAIGQAPETPVGPVMNRPTLLVTQTRAAAWIPPIRRRHRFRYTLKVAGLIPVLSSRQRRGPLARFVPTDSRHSGTGIWTSHFSGGSRYLARDENLSSAPKPLIFSIR